MTDPLFTMDDVRRNGWVAVRDDVLDLRRFAAAHPGGAFLRRLGGRDATHEVLNAHAKNPVVLRVLRRFRVGALDPATTDPLDRDLLALRDSLAARGMFDYRAAWLVADFARFAALFALGAWLSFYSAAAALVVLAAASVDLVWWIHDAGHDAVFASESRARFAIEALGVALLGMPQRTYHYGVHRIHHGFLNVLGEDLALETGPVVWHRAMAHRAPAWLRPLQPALWFLVVLPLAFPALLYAALAGCVRKRQWWSLAALAVRWPLVVFGLFRGDWALAVLPPVIAGTILGFMAGLNHFHLPISAAMPSSFARGVVERTQNVRAGRLWTWVSGGLNFHIEHHLFATMPSRNYARVAPEVQALCAAHGVRYRVCGRRDAVLNLFRKLRAPFAEGDARDARPAERPLAYLERCSTGFGTPCGADPRRAAALRLPRCSDGYSLVAAPSPPSRLLPHDLPNRHEHRSEPRDDLVSTAQSTSQPTARVPVAIAAARAHHARRAEALAYAVVRGSAVALPLVVLAGCLRGGWASYAGFAVVFGFYFCVEAWLFATGRGTGTTRADEFRFAHAAPGGHRRAQYPLYLYAALQLAVAPAVLLLVARGTMTAFELVGATLSLGAMAGSVGGLAGHEFIHRKNRWERLAGIAIYATVNYAHFRVSHLGGHHRNVGLREDWSTARRGESLYAFLARAVGHGLRGAWTLEAARLASRGRSPWSPRNFVLRYAAFELALVCAIGLFLGAAPLAVFALASALAVALMETVNYLSHYGLTRARGADGRPEPIQNKHSWESNNKVTNWFIFNAGKHCHHHRHPSHTHDQLTLCHEKNYLPHGLPLMTLIALVPPLYFRTMDPLVDAADASAATTEARS